MKNLIALFFLTCIVCDEVLFDGMNYLRFIARKRTTNKFSNFVEVDFRTVHPSGVLVLLNSPHNEALMIELTQGKLSYTEVLSKEKRQTIVLGELLNDNEWHSIKVARKGRVNEITIDGEKKTSLTQAEFQSVSFRGIAYIGGMDPRVESFKGSKWFSGCIRIKNMDMQDPIALLREGSNEVLAIPDGRVTFGCGDAKKNSVVKLTMPQSTFGYAVNRSRDFHASFLMRTFAESGKFVLTLFGDYCEMALTLEKRRLVFKGVQEDSFKMTLRKVVNDGHWHNVTVSVSSTRVQLRVDDLPVQQSSIYCPRVERVKFGNRAHTGGYVGCLGHLVVNGEAKVFDDEFVSTATKVELGCKLSDKCFPSPCLNGGICSQSWTESKCDCTRTSYYGKTCQSPIYRSSCDEYRSVGLKEESYCLIDTDGPGSLQPHTTLCKFDKNGNVYTSVSHDKVGKFDVTDSQDKFQSQVFHDLKYEFDEKVIEALIETSNNCRQQLTFFCNNSLLFDTPSGVPNVGWKGRDDVVKQHWSGVSSGRRGCACGQTRSCIDPTKLCNCDSLNNKWMSDDGYITDKRVLPIKMLTVTGVLPKTGFIYIGPLKCFGQSKRKPSLEKAPKDMLILSKACVSSQEAASRLKAVNDSQLWVTGPPLSERYVTRTTPVITTGPMTVGQVFYTVSPNKGVDKRASERRFTPLEMVLVGVACFALLLLVLKIIICNINKRQGQFLINHDHNQNTDSQITKIKRSITSYWV